MNQFRIQSERLWIALLVSSAVFFHWQQQWPWLFQPLFNDEQYYASPLGLTLGIFQWPVFSFGHPPGWPVLNWLAFQMFGANTQTARAVGLLLSTGFLIIIPWLMARTAGLLAAALFLLGIFSNRYFQDYSAHNQPIIATCLFGIVALFFFSKSRFVAFLLAVSSAILIRESSLVYLAASYILRPQRKILKLLLLPLILFGVTYAWSFFVLRKLPLNPQMEAVVGNGQSIFIFHLPHIIRFYQNVFFANGWLYWAIVILGGTCFIYRGRLSHGEKLPLSLFIVFLLDSAFFSLYRDSDPRNFFISSVALLLFGALNLGHFFLNRTKARTQKYVFVAFLLSLFFNLPSHHSALLAEQRETTAAIRRISTQLHDLRAANQSIDIVSTNPFTHYFNEPYLGYWPEPLNVRWHGGVPGATQLQLPDAIVLATSGYENPITLEMRKFIAENSANYQLQQAEEIPSGNAILALYVHKQSTKMKVNTP